MNELEFIPSNSTEPDADDVTILEEVLNHPDVKMLSDTQEIKVIYSLCFPTWMQHQEIQAPTTGHHAAQ